MSATEERGAAVSPAEAPTATLAPVPVGSGQEQCLSCGAPLASDQRYCVECGQRLGRARLPLMDSPLRERTPAPGSARPRSRNAATVTLIAAIGTLLLAMGVGVLIGRSGQGSSSNAPSQVITVPSAAASTAPSPGASATETPSGTPAEPTTAAKATKGAAAAGAKSSTGNTSAKAPAAQAPKATKAPPPKVVKVGSAGKGPGYQKGHFTGNFFGEGEE